MDDGAREGSLPRRVEPFPVTLEVPATLAEAGAKPGLLVFASDRGDRLLVLHAGVYEAFEPLVARVGLAVKELEIDAESTEAPRALDHAGATAVSGDLAGVGAQGHPLALTCAMAVTGRGLGAFVLGVAPREDAGDLRELVDRVAASTAFEALARDADAALALVGRWSRSTAETSGGFGRPSGSIASEASFTFGEDGTFAYHERSIASASAGDASLSTSDEDEVQGTFLVVADHLVLASETGSQTLELERRGEFLLVGGVAFERVA